MRTIGRSIRRWSHWSWKTTPAASCRLRRGSRRSVLCRCLPSLCTLTYCLHQTTQQAYDRIVEGISAVLLTLKRRPVIRFSQTYVLTTVLRCPS